MTRHKVLGLAAVGAVGALVLTACGTSGGGGKSTSSVAYNQSITSTVNSSTHKGGTIIYDNSSGPDSTDAGNTYYAFNLNFTRLYATPLTTYKSCPGACGEQIVPALATSLGTASDGNRVWTYQIKSGVKFEDGQPVTSADVKYAVERTFARSVLVNGPTYFAVLLAGNAKTYPGPYKDKSPAGLTAITTPNPTTIVFHLNQPFADFNYVVAFPQTAPVPPNKDTGANYQLHPQSTGPYKFLSYQLNKSYVLVRNPEWNPSWDPQVTQLPSKIIVNLNVNANTVDSNLMAGTAQVDQAGSGVQTAARDKIISSASLKANSDDPVTGFMWFFYLNIKVKPLNNVHCREAIEYAADKTSLLAAQGGPYGGSIASTAMPPTVIGYKSFDLYHALSMPGGDIAAAKQQLALCGHPKGFATNIAYRSDRPREVAAAQALQAALARVGITTGLKSSTAANYYGNFAGVPTYVHSHDLGILSGGWGADWPDAWGWFDEISNGNAIAPSGNTNIAELNDPLVNGWLSGMQTSTTQTQKNSYANKIDMEVMKDAVILPETYNKALLYRSPDLTNVNVQTYYGMYNYAILGAK